MKRVLKIFAVLIVLVLVVVTAAVVTVVNIDPNEHKAWIADKVKDATGRDLKLEGDIRLSYYPWLGVEAKGITLGNAPGFGDEPFLHTDFVKLRIKLLPLLQRRYEVDTVAVHGAVINLARNKEGVSNWDDLAGPKVESETPAAAKELDLTPLAGLLLGGVDIRDARLRWRDRQQDLNYDISRINLSTGSLVYGEPIALQLGLNVNTNRPAIKGDAKLDGTITYDIKNQHYSIKPLNFVTNLQGNTLPDGKARISFSTEIVADLAGDSADISAISIEGLGTSLTGHVHIDRLQTPGPVINSKLSVKGGDLAQLFKAADIEPLASQLGRLQQRGFSVQMELDADLKQGSVNLPRFEARLLGAEIKSQLKASNIQSATPGVAGSVDASGPDLPSLMQVAGQLTGGKQSPLTTYGGQLARLPAGQKAFSVKAGFDADMKSGDIKLPSLAVDALGVQLTGNLQAAGVQTDKGTVTGKLALQGSDIRGVLVALDQQPLSESLQSVHLDVGISGSSSDLNLKPVTLKATLSGKEIPNSPVDVVVKADTNINTGKDTLTLSSFSIAGLDLDVQGHVAVQKLSAKPEISGALDVAQFNLRKLMRQLNQTLPPTADNSVLTKVALKADYAGSADSIDISKLALVLDDTRISGNLAVKDFNKPATRFNIDIDAINADRYLPPEPEGKAAAGKGAAPKPAAAAPTAAPTAAPAEPTPIPVETLRALDSQGELNIGKLTISNAKLANIKLKLNAKGGKVVLDPVAAELYQGKYNGTIQLDATGKVPQLALNTSLIGIEAGPLLQDLTGEKPQLEGNGSFKADLKASGANTDRLKKSLTGTADINFMKGTLHGVDVRSVLEQVEIMIESKRFGKVEPGEKTEFDKLTGTLDFNNGVITNKDLLMAAPGFKVSGKGMLADLHSETIKYDLTLAVDQASATRQEERYNIGNYTVPVQCRKSIYEPDCKPDADKIAKTVLKKSLLDKVLGDEKKPAAPPPATDGAQTQQQQQKPPEQQAPQKPREQVKEALKDILKGL